MSTETTIHPQLATAITGNIGNKLTAELAAGILATLQPLLAQVATEAFAAGQAAAQQGQTESVDVTDVEPKA